MNTADIPQIIASNYTTSSGPIGFDEMVGGAAGAAAPWDYSQTLIREQPIIKDKIQIIMPATNRRIVQVFIADPNDNVPLEKSILYTGEQKLTDLNDTELFFEIPIKELLDKHNIFRVTVGDREASKRAGKDIFLDPVKIRDLKMLVVTVAQF